MGLGLGLGTSGLDYKRLVYLHFLLAFGIIIIVALTVTCICFRKKHKELVVALNLTHKNKTGLRKLLHQATLFTASLCL